MFDMRNHKSGCGYTEMVIDYVYEEMDSSEREAFESHLDTCGLCPEQISGFASVSNAIGDWKRNSFDVLPAPNFENPAIPETVSLEANTHSRESFGDRIRGFFGSYTLLWQSASAIAAILLTIGLAWVFLVGTTAKDNKAAVESPANHPVSNEILIAEDADQGSSDEENMPPVDSGSSDEIKSPDSTGQEEFAVNKKPPVRRRSTSGSKPLKVTNRKPTGSPTKRSAPPVKDPNKVEQNAPVIERLTELASSDEAEDEGLRLTELFAIAESDER